MARRNQVKPGQVWKDAKGRRFLVIGQITENNKFPLKNLETNRRTLKGPRALVQLTREHMDPGENPPATPPRAVRAKAERRKRRLTPAQEAALQRGRAQAKRKRQDRHRRTNPETAFPIAQPRQLALNPDYPHDLDEGMDDMEDYGTEINPQAYPHDLDLMEEGRFAEPPFGSRNPGSYGARRFNPRPGPGGGYGGGYGHHRHGHDHGDHGMYDDMGNDMTYDTYDTSYGMDDGLENPGSRFRSPARRGLAAGGSVNLTRGAFAGGRGRSVRRSNPQEYPSALTEYVAKHLAAMDERDAVIPVAVSQACARAVAQYANQLARSGVRMTSRGRYY